jgi:hypothetical protein
MELAQDYLFPGCDFISGKNNYLFYPCQVWQRGVSHGLNKRASYFSEFGITGVDNPLIFMPEQLAHQASQIWENAIQRILWLQYFTFVNHRFTNRLYDESSSLVGFLLAFWKLSSSFKEERHIVQGSSQR